MAMFPMLTAAAAPGLALLTYFYLKDRYVSEPLSMVLKYFLFGVLLVFPIMVIQRGLLLGLGDQELLFSFVTSAGIEQFVKWFVLFFTFYSHRLFDEPYDGIVYGVSISLGFATMENIIYAWAYDANFGMLLFRAILPVSGHALFGVVMGYYLGKARFYPRQEKRFLLYSLLLPILWHGTFDWIILRSESEWFWFIVPFMLTLWLYSLKKVSMANSHSPFRSVFMEEEVEIPSKST
ncbi:glutamic-type intramembrane protease PrsW [Marinicrinis sediminis]|uniref:Protease PrsW n=1 Tax=Marinicrinis sediminis TaxID=1652465 RepID=A0ABW5RDT5_9BACL